MRKKLDELLAEINRIELRLRAEHERVGRPGQTFQDMVRKLRGNLNHPLGCDARRYNDLMFLLQNDEDYG